MLKIEKRGGNFFEGIVQLAYKIPRFKVNPAICLLLKIKCTIKKSDRFEVSFIG